MKGRENPLRDETKRREKTVDLFTAMKGKEKNNLFLVTMGRKGLRIQSSVQRGQQKLGAKKRTQVITRNDGQ